MTLQPGVGSKDARKWNVCQAQRSQHLLNLAGNNMFVYKQGMVGGRNAWHFNGMTEPFYDLALRTTKHAPFHAPRSEHAISQEDGSVR